MRQPLSTFRPVWLAGLVCLAWNPANVLPVAADEGHFRERIAPLFAVRCLGCHNSLDRKGGFSLQTADEFAAVGAVTAGDPAASWLIDQVTSTDGAPPAMPKTGEHLSNKEVAALREWIEAGADWPDGFQIEDPVVNRFDWWSLQPLSRPTVPDARGDATGQNWIRNPVDAFVLAGLKQRELAPTPQANRQTLLRRLYFDLTGLPPTPEEIRAFVDDPDPNAWEKQVDRLLALPRYGEHWGRYWLDLARYADTCGYDKDKLRPNAWPYRDYVIRAFNEDKPYQRFVEEQLAGDELYPGSADGILGLGFIAAGPWDFIGHVEVPESRQDGLEARNLDRDEMVAATMNVFCSMTVQCARCHNHKFDPVTQDHYYGLQAVFAAVDRADRVYEPDPVSEARRAELVAERERLAVEVAAHETAAQNAGGAELAELEKQLALLKAGLVPISARAEFGYHSAIASSASEEKWVEVDLGSAIRSRKVVIRPCHDDFAGIGAGFGFPEEFTVAVSSGEDEPWTIVFASVTCPVGHPAQPLVIELAETVAPVRRIRLTAQRLAERSGDYILALAELQVLDATGGNLAAGVAVHALDSIEAPVRWAKRNLTDGFWPDFGPVAEDPAAIEELNSLLVRRSELLKTTRPTGWQTRQGELQTQLAAVDESLAKLPAGKLVHAAATMFSGEGSFRPTLGTPRPVFVLHRGNVAQPLEEAVPGTVPLAAGDPVRFDLSAGHAEGERRAALARWITDRDNPLTWRSIVNRVWLHHFGHGLVDSPNDFGRMGQTPTHPELLDWLACEFRDGRQSFRDLHRLILTSATWQQASAGDPAKAATDSDNRFLWRMPRRRLQAEEVRDAMLAVSGPLDLTMGGPGDQLFGLEKTEHSPHYSYHLFDPEKAATHRRSVYRFVVRSQPDPFMTVLDGADCAQSVPQRDETLTALQALSLMNNRFVLVMSERLAERLEREHSDPAARVVAGFEAVTGRLPSAEEQADLLAFAEGHGLPALARVLFNLNEFVFVD